MTDRHARTVGPLFDDGAPKVRMSVPLDTATLAGARFSRALILTSGLIVAEFFPQDLKLHRILLDEAEISAAAIFAPSLNAELTTALEAIERMRRRVARR